MNVVHNEPCPCGSGKKFKYCCSLPFEIKKEEIQGIYNDLIELLKTNDIKLPNDLLNKELDWRIIVNKNYFIFSISSSKELQRIDDLVSRGLDPFPGLICQGEISSSIKLDKSKNANISNSQFNNIYVFNLGKDCTITMSNNTQTINTLELGEYSYVIELAYVISFGDEIIRSTVYEYLKELINNSIKSWRDKK